jgi:hypothetical protein
MSLFDDSRYTWRETYFVLFDSKRRPCVDDVRRELLVHAGALRLLDSQAEPDGTLFSVTIASYENHAALEIIYREGDDVHDDIISLIQTLENDCTEKEREQLQKARNYRAKFDILHFEQTAETAAFDVLKLPELKFRKPPVFPNRFFSDRLTSRPRKRFHFDTDSYQNCVNDRAGEEIDWKDQAETEDSSVYERIDPNTLLLVLEILCRLTHGVAVDPASGIVI